MCRILVKVIPHSVALISSSEEGGGGNRISEEQIKSYLDNALGDAPRPMWGLPGGWGDYCSTLFSWVANRPITVDQAMRCAKREPGRSWEALESELNKLGLFPQTWPLPLTRQGLMEAAQNPIPQAVPTGPISVKRQPSYHNQDGPPVVKAEKGSRRKISGGNVGTAPAVTPADSEMDRLSEAEVWTRVLRLIEVAKQKQGTSSAEDAAAVNSAQMRAQKLMQDLAMTRAGLVMSPGMPAAIPAPGLPGAFARAAAPGPAGHMALVPVMLQNADGSLTAAYQVQPVPTAGFATESFPADGQFPGLGGAPVIAAPSPNSMNLLMQPGSGSSAFQSVQQHAKPMLAGGVNSPQGRSIAKPQPIRPRIGALPASAPVPSRTLNGFHADGQRAGSASPSTQDNDEEPRDFDIGSILRPTPMKPESVRRIGESQEAASPALPIHSLHTPDLATLQGSQGMATSLSALQNNLHSQTWQQHAEEPSQQDGAGQRAAAPAGPSQQGSQQSPAPVQSPDGAARHTEHAAEAGLAHQQQHSQQGLLSGDAGSQHAPSGSGQGNSQQQGRAPKRKLPFSVGLQPDAKRQSPGPDQAAVPMQSSQNSAVPLLQPLSAAQAAPVPANESDKIKASSGFASPHKSPLYQSNVQLMSPSVLLLPQQESPSNGKHNSHSQGTASIPTQWQLSQQC